MQQNKILIGPILFLYYEECLASSNLNSKLLRFHFAHPNIYTSPPIRKWQFHLTLCTENVLYVGGWVVQKWPKHPYVI